MQTRTITVDYARPRGYDVGYRAENNFTLLALPIPAELEGADSYRVYFESTVGEYLQTEPLTPADGYVTVEITSDVVPEPGNMAAQLVAFADGEIVGYAPMITGSAKVSIPDGTERLSHSLAAEIALNTAARHSHSNKAVLDKFSETDGKPTYDGEALGGGGGAGDFIIKMTVASDDSGNYTVTSCDATIEQIEAAVAAEKRVVVIASYGGIIFELPMLQGIEGNTYYFGMFLDGQMMTSSVEKIGGNTSEWQFLVTEIEAEDVDYSNTALPNISTVSGALDELVPKSHTHANKDTLDKLSDSNGKLQYNGSDVGLKGADGTDGKDGITPTIGANGNWYLDTTDTGKPSRGEKGDKGDPGSDANVTKANVITALGYTPEAVSAQVSTGSNITLADNTEYRLADVTTLNLSYPTGKFECWMRLTFAASGNITVTLPTDTEYLGATPNFKNGETWELSFKDKVLAAKKVGADDGGAGGENGITPHIGDNGNWYIGNTDTGKPSRGEKGDKGATGESGADGKSAYQIALDNGFVGSQSEWLASLKGATGASGAPGADYTLTEADKVEIADMVDGATIVQAPKYVNSVTEMTDINRPYVLISTGHIWANANVEVEKPITEVVNATDENPYHTGYRFGSDVASDSMTAGATGYFLTPLIDLTKAAYQGKTIQLHLEGAHFASDTALETWIQARVYGVDKSVLVNRYYVFADMTNDNNIAHHCNGTMSIAYNSETSATVTLNVPPTYGASATPIGYIRFCAKGAVANSNITITYTDISTGVQWYDTGTTYGGGQDAQLAEKVAALNNEGSTPAAYNLLTPAVIEYYNKAAYPDGDYSATNFVSSTLPYRSDIPQPVTLKWQHNEDAVQTTISVNTSATVLSTGVKQYDATGYDNYPIYNLLPNKTYYYTVTHLLADGSLVTAKTGSFTTSSIPWRLLKVDGIQNVRDLGGWSGLNGQKVKYEKLFRGSALDDSTFPDLILTGRGRTELVSTLGIRADLDLRYNYTESAISKDMAFLCKGYGSYAQAITTPDYRDAFKAILEWIVARLSESHPKPVYFHCQGGCDRTGTLSFLLLGLLGVSESDLARDYELSSFSAIGAGRVRNSTVYGYSAMVAALKTYAGSTLAEKFADFAETGCGVSADTISSFRGLMLE